MRDAAWRLTSGANTEVVFCSCLHRRVQKTVLGSRLVLEDSFIVGKPRFPTGKRKVGSPQELVGKDSSIQRCIVLEPIL